jgi:spermidine/putrescine transport system substrate-binding protein
MAEILASNKLSRRRVLQTGVVAIGARFGARPLISRAAEPLRFLCWGGWSDPSIVQEFTDQTGIPIQATFPASNDDIFLKLRAGGIGRFDVVTPQNGVVQGMIDVGLIQPLDESRLTHFGENIPQFQQPEWSIRDGVRYAAPFLWGSSPLAYNAEMIEAAPESWVGLEADTYRKKIVMLDDGLTHFRVWNRALGAEDATKVTPEQLDRTTETLMALKSKQVVALVRSMDDVAAYLARGDAWVSTSAWELVPAMKVAKDKPVRTFHPLPGDFTFCDTLCLVANAPQPDAAHDFINYMTSPEVQARAMNRMVRGVVNAQAVPMLDEGVRSLFHYDDLDNFFASNPLLGFPPLGDNDEGFSTYTDWVNAWERVRTAKAE